MVAAIVFLALVLVVVVFQLALVAGMPWGELTWGGKFTGKLPGSMRVVTFISAVLLVAFGMIVSIRAGVLFPDWQPISRTLIWFVVAYCILGRWPMQPHQADGSDSCGCRSSSVCSFQAWLLGSADLDLDRASGEGNQGCVVGEHRALEASPSESRDDLHRR